MFALPQSGRRLISISSIFVDYDYKVGNSCHFYIFTASVMVRENENLWSLEV